MWSGEDQPGESPPDQVSGPISGSTFDESDTLSSPPLQANSRLYGCIAIIPGSAVHIGSDERGAIFISATLIPITHIDLKDNVTIIEEGFHLDKKSMSTLDTAGVSDLTSDGLTAIGGSGIGFGSRWTNIDEDEGATKDDVASVFSSSIGATVCKRYVDGTITTDPLFPWPMQQRIIDAFERSGRTPGFSVEGEVQRHLGIIPAGCIDDPPDPDPPEVKKIWIGGGSTDGGALGV